MIHENDVMDLSAYGVAKEIGKVVLFSSNGDCFRANMFENFGEIGRFPSLCEESGAEKSSGLLPHIVFEQNIGSIWLLCFHNMLTLKRVVNGGSGRLCSPVVSNCPRGWFFQQIC